MIWIVPRCLLLCQNIHVCPADKERLKGIQAYVKLEKLITSLGKNCFGFCHFLILLFMNSCHKSLIMWYNRPFENSLFLKFCVWIAMLYALFSLNRASDISHGRGPAKFRDFREIPRNSPKNAKYRQIRQIHVGKTYLILILAIRPVLFTPNVQICLETLSLQRVNNVPKLPGVFRWTLRKTGH